MKIRQLVTVLFYDLFLRILHYKNAGVLSSLCFSPVANTGGGVTSSCSSLPSRAACTSAQTFSGLRGISMVLIPSGASASNTALTTAGGAPMQPASPTPFAPNG